MQEQPGTLCGVPVLVEVNRDGRDSLDPEVPEWNGGSRSFHVGQDHASHAGIHVHVESSVCGESCEGSDVIHHPLWVRRGAGHEQNRVLVDGPDHRSDVGAPVRSNGHPSALHTEIVSTLLERSVRRGRKNHVRGIQVPALTFCSLQGRTNRQDEALGTS